MSVAAQQIVVGHATPVLLVDAGDTETRFRLRAGGQGVVYAGGTANPVFIGGSGVTPSTGYELEASQEFIDVLQRKGKIFGICGGTDTCTVCVWTATK